MAYIMKRWYWLEGEVCPNKTDPESRTTSTRTIAKPFWLLTPPDRLPFRTCPHLNAAPTISRRRLRNHKITESINGNWYYIRNADGQSGTFASPICDCIISSQLRGVFWAATLPSGEYNDPGMSRRQCRHRRGLRVALRCDDDPAEGMTRTITTGTRLWQVPADRSREEANDRPD
jgi:hypothetical protein